ncbi:MAG TPA: hypothetical protein VLF20_05180, partial [Patescibacteria group bacterium]|nr:hypothetical protein [Patescibacteria group bacterium]
GYEEFANGLVSNVIRDIFIVSTIAESGIALREWDERRRIKGRAGKVEGGEYTDKEFKAQIKRAVDLIEMPGNRATEVEKLYAVLDPIRHKKWKAFDALPQSAKDAIEDNARRIETIDNLSKNVIRPSAVVSRIIRRKGIRTLLEDRRQIRAEADYVYVPPEHRLSDSPNGKYVRASALTA